MEDDTIDRHSDRGVVKHLGRYLEALEVWQLLNNEDPRKKKERYRYGSSYNALLLGCYRRRIARERLRRMVRGR